MLPGSGKTFINSALAYAAKDRIARFAGLVAGISIVAINSAIIAATGRRPGLASHRSLEVLLAAISRRELLGKLAFTAWRTWNRIASNAEALLFGQPNFSPHAR
jgi:hypothetical protein